MYKNSRKIVFFAIAFLLSLTQFLPINIFGQELNTTSDLDFNYYYSDSNQQTVQKYNLEVNEEWNNFLENISVQPLSIVTEKRSTSVPLNDRNAVIGVGQLLCRWFCFRLKELHQVNLL